MAHAQEEEAEVFPRLRSALEPEEQTGLSHALLRLREALAPTPSPVSGSERLLEEPRSDGESCETIVFFVKRIDNLCLESY